MPQYPPLCPPFPPLISRSPSSLHVSHFLTDTVTSAHPPTTLRARRFRPFLTGSLPLSLLLPSANLEMNESSRWTEEEMETAKKGKTEELSPSQPSTRWSQKAPEDEDCFLLCAQASDVAATSCLTRSNCHVLLSCERVCACACVSFSRDWILFALWNSPPPLPALSLSGSRQPVSLSSAL